MAKRDNVSNGHTWGDGPDRDRVSSVLRGSAGLRPHFPVVEQSSVHDQMLNGRADVFVNLSKSEGLPVTIMEAQCVGLPVVATAVRERPRSPTRG